jgi:hypothetical protein
VALFSGFRCGVAVFRAARTGHQVRVAGLCQGDLAKFLCVGYWNPDRGYWLDYKRNQVEDAIARLLEPGSAKPSSEMHTRLKRLLETDRGLGRNKRSGNPERANFAFYTADAPGRGADSRFSGYVRAANGLAPQVARMATTICSHCAAPCPTGAGESSHPDFAAGCSGAF